MHTAVALLSSLLSFVTSAFSSLSAHVQREVSLPLRLFCLQFLAVNGLLPLLFLHTAVARVVLYYCVLSVAVSAGLLQLLGPSPLLFSPFLSLLPLLLSLPSAFASCCSLIVVEHRPVLLLPEHLLSPSLFLLWLWLLCVTDTACLLLVLAEARKAVAVERRGGKEGERGAQLGVRVEVGDDREGGELLGQWQLELKVEVKARRRRGNSAAEAESRMEEGEAEPQQQPQQREGSGSSDRKQGRSAEEERAQAEGWARAAKREAAEASLSDEEHPREPPSSPASPQSPSRPPPLERPSSSQQQEEQRGPFQSPRAVHRSLAGLRQMLHREAASHDCFLPSSASISAPHGDPVMQAASKSIKKEGK